jgi:phage gpG-like protein
LAASFTVNLESLKSLVAKMSDSRLSKRIDNIANEKGASAIVSQAIADNFAVRGPGWLPLKVRKGMPLQKTGLLKRSVTTVGAPGNVHRVEGQSIIYGTNLDYAAVQNFGGTITPKNAKALFIPISKKGERVGPIKDPKDRKGKDKLVYGKDFVLAKSVRVPARPFLVIRPGWQAKLEEWTMTKMISYVREEWGIR